MKRTKNKETDRLVWVPHPTEGYLQCRVLPEESSDGYLVVEGLETGERLETVEQLAIPLLENNVDYGKVEDLTSLLDLNSATLLQALHDRFDNQNIYTRTGQILLAINPYQRLKGLYTDAVFSRYIDSANDTASDALPPHAYDVARHAYQSMVINKGRNQSILVSGESGAGKTETTKIVLRYLTEVAQTPSSTGKSSGAKNGKGNEISTAVIESNPLLEAFGNAKTVRNDNSSRFGKLLQLQFDPSKNNLIGATVDTYLLEKARVINQSKGERNFHIFYELATYSKKDKYLFPDLEECRYSSESRTFKRNDLNDREVFEETLKSMEVMGLSETERDSVFSIVSAILHLGNLDFSEVDNAGSAFAKDSRTQMSLKAFCKLIQVSESDLEKALCSRTISTGGGGGLMGLLRSNESLIKMHTVDQAVEARGALAMTLYQRMFYWLVWKVNHKVGELGEGGSLGRVLDQRMEKLKEFAQVLERNQKLNKTTPEYINDYAIGCLDIFGFEVFESNNLNQLCINYANERLCAQFNEFVFKRETLFYESEGIDWSSIDFPDNAECLALIEGGSSKTDVGLLRLIDEECMFPQGNDKSLHAKIMKNMKIAPMTITATGKSMQMGISRQRSTMNINGGVGVVGKTMKRNLKFIVNHFAGEVEYDVKGFYDMNKDELRKEAIILLRGSKDPLVKILLPMDAVNNSQDSNESGRYFHDCYEKEKRSNKRRMVSSFERLKDLEDNLNSKAQKLQQKTVTRQFKDQLFQALRYINASEPHYIRCIKPNDESSKSLFNRARVLEQLNYSGVLAVVKVSRAGYSTRFTHVDFIQRYMVLAPKNVKIPMPLPKKMDQLQKLCNAIATASEMQLVKDYQVGRSMTVLRSASFCHIEGKRNAALHDTVVKLQSWYRSRNLRKKFLAKKKHIVIVQRVFRGYADRKKTKKLRIALIKLQAEKREKARKEKERLEAIERQRLEEEKRKADAKRKADEEERSRVAAEQKRIEDERIQRELEERRKREELERVEREAKELREQEEREARELKLKKEREERELREKREREERELREKERRELEQAKLLVKQTAAATKIQSVVRVILAQKRANELWEQREEQRLRENAARKKHRSRDAASTTPSMKPRKNPIKKRKAMKRTKKPFFNIKLPDLTPENVEKMVMILIPMAVLYILSNPKILMTVMLVGFSMAAGASVVSAAQADNGAYAYTPEAKEEIAILKRTVSEVAATRPVVSIRSAPPELSARPIKIQPDPFDYAAIQASGRVRSYKVMEGSTNSLFDGPVPHEKPYEHVIEKPKMATPKRKGMMRFFRGSKKNVLNPLLE